MPDTNTLNEPIVGFVLGQTGLMYNLSFEGTKFTKLDKKQQTASSGVFLLTSC